jgi:hypothetical protein
VRARAHTHTHTHPLKTLSRCHTPRMFIHTQDSTARSIHIVNNMFNGTLFPTSGGSAVHDHLLRTSGGSALHDHLLPTSGGKGQGDDVVVLPHVLVSSLPTHTDDGVAVGSKVWVRDGCKPHEQAGQGLGCTGVEAVFDSSHRWLRTCDYHAVQPSLP